ncbi:MAG TPA: hypothetical protein VHR45_10065 [Thermoanaerobaculia bacterium]|nr:hypothetical protein [Thermoanaerobaculia bacterium]
MSKSSRTSKAGAAKAKTLAGLTKAAGQPAGHRKAATGNEARSNTRTCPPQSDAASGAETADEGKAPGWCQPLELYREYFGLEPESGQAAMTLAAGASALRSAMPPSYLLRFIVALVPDPIDTQIPSAFDQALDGIQEGLAHNSYLLDRSWVPWTGAAAEGQLYHRSPGLLLFRHRAATTGEDELLGVLLVGETPKRGIHKDAFLAALRLIDALRPGNRAAQIRVLGPSYSGSAESLHLALLSAEHEFQRSLRFLIVTGSATSPDLEGRLYADGLSDRVEFFRTVLPSDVLQREALLQLQRTMGWDLSRLALVTESDTSYGQGFRGARLWITYETCRFKVGKAGHEDCAAKRAAMGERVVLYNTADKRIYKLDKQDIARPHLGREVTVTGAVNGDDGDQIAIDAIDEESAPLVFEFPSHISTLRTSSEAEAAKKAASQPEQVALHSKTDLDLTLADSGRGTDVVPDFSPLTAPDTELAIASLLETISREGIRYVGIVATDVKDKLFLAERIRRFSPDVVLFTIGGDLLFGHRAVQSNMNGMVVLSTFPLFAEGGAWLHGIGGALHAAAAFPSLRNGLYEASILSGGSAGFPFQPQYREPRRQFGSESEQGISYAAEALVSPTLPGKSAELMQNPVFGWISVTSNGSLWPVLNVGIQRRDLLHSGYQLLAYPDPDSSGTGQENNGLSSRADFELFVVALLLAGLSWWLRRVVLFKRWRGEARQLGAASAAGSRAAKRTAAFVQTGLQSLDGDIRRNAGDPRGVVSGPPARRLAVGHSRGLLRVGVGLAAFAGAVLIALDSSAYFKWWWPDEDFPAASLHFQQLVFLLLLVAAYLFQWGVLAETFVPVARRRVARSWLRKLLWGGLWLAAAGAVLALVIGALTFYVAPGEPEYFLLRARVFSSGLSPVVSLGLVLAALLAWVLLELKRRRLIALQDVAWPLADEWNPVLEGSGRLAEELRLLTLPTSRPGRRFKAVLAAAWRRRVDMRVELRGLMGSVRKGMSLWIAVASALAVTMIALKWPRVQALAESPVYAYCFLGLLLVAAVTSGLSFGRFWQVWSRLLKILQRLEGTPLRGRFAALHDEVGWKPMRSFGWQIPRFKTLMLSAEQLRDIVSAEKECPDSLRNAGYVGRLENLVRDTFAADCEDGELKERRRRRQLRCLLNRAGMFLQERMLKRRELDQQARLHQDQVEHLRVVGRTGAQKLAVARAVDEAEAPTALRDVQLAADDEPAAGAQGTRGSSRSSTASAAAAAGEPAVADFLALRVIAYLWYLFAQLRSFLMEALFPGLLLLIAASSYSFEPKSLVSMALLGALLGAVVLTLGVFVAINRNPVLTLISGVEAGKSALDGAFFLSVLKYGVIPLVALLATQVPAAGQFLNEWLRPVLRIVGIG